MAQDVFPAVPDQTAPAGGQVFVQDAQPVGVGGSYAWVQTGLGASGTGWTLWIEDPDLPEAGGPTGSLFGTVVEAEAPSITRTVVPVTTNVVVANTTTKTTLLSVIIPANSLKIGTTYHLYGAGYRDTNTTGTPTVVMGMEVVGVTGGGDGVTLAYPVQGGVSNMRFRLDGHFTCRSIGLTGVGMIEWRNDFAQGDHPVNDISTYLGWTDPIDFTIDTTIQQTLRFYAQWSVAHANNRIELETGYTELLV